jgi:hypothetical protein
LLCRLMGFRKFRNERYLEKPSNDTRCIECLLTKINLQDLLRNIEEEEEESAPVGPDVLFDITELVCRVAQRERERERELLLRILT